MIKFIKQQYVNGNIFYFIIIAICLYAIFPFVYLIQYNLPGASDDVLHSFYLKDKSYFNGIMTWYKTGYNGRFANAVLMQLPERPFMNIWFARSFPLLLILSLTISIYYFITSFKTKDTKNNLLFSLLTMTFFMSYTPSIHQFYWYSGSSVYIVPTILYFFLLGILIRYFNKKMNFFHILFSIICIFFIIGSHESWMIIGFLTILIFFVNEIYNKRKLKLSSYIIIFWALTLLLLFLLAPGNSHRLVGESNSAENANLWASASLSLLKTGTFIKDWYLNIGFIIIAIGILIHPIKDQTNKTNSKHSLSIYILVLSIVLTVFISTFIVMFSLGHLKDFRLRGILPGYFVSTILVIILLKFLNLRQIKLFKKTTINTSLFLISIGLGLLVSNSKNVKNAYIDIFSKNAKIESEQILWTYNFIINSKENVLSIPMINRMTKTLYLPKVPEVGSFYSWALDQYFNKKIVVNKNISYEKFHFQNDTTISKCEVKLSQNNQFSCSYKFPIDEINKSAERTFLVQAKIKNPEDINKDTKTMIVFDSSPYWKGFYLKDLVDTTGFLYFKHKVPKNYNYDNNEFKVYFYNPSNDSIVISKINVTIL
jgi:hypothetical protein